MRRRLPGIASKVIISFSAGSHTESLLLELELKFLRRLNKKLCTYVIHLSAVVNAAVHSYQVDFAKLPHQKFAAT